jgi:hypothetical protein
MWLQRGVFLGIFLLQATLILGIWRLDDARFLGKVWALMLLEVANLDE